MARGSRAIRLESYSLALGASVTEPFPTQLCFHYGIIKMADLVKYPYYTQAAVLSVLSALSVILQIPPALWHFQHRNLAATTLVCWIMVQNLMIFVNSLIWPTDDVFNWWKGAGFCDVQVHILIFSYMSCAGCVLCIMQGLARVLDTDDVIIAPSRARRMRRAAFHVFWCFVFPAVMTGVYYVVQNFRYYLYGIVGCIAPIDGSWLGILLIPSPPFIIGLTASFYASKCPAINPPKILYPIQPPHSFPS